MNRSSKKAKRKKKGWSEFGGERLLKKASAQHLNTTEKHERGRERELVILDLVT